MFDERNILWLNKYRYIRSAFSQENKLARRIVAKAHVKDGAVAQVDISEVWELVGNVLNQ